MLEHLKKAYLHLPGPVQNAAVSLRGLEIYFERYGRDFKEASRFLEETQWASKERIAEIQFRLLLDVISVAAQHVPYYRRVFREHGLSVKSFQSIDDLRKIPILTKADIRSHFSEMVSDQADTRKLKLGHTSGTTGSPLEFYWDKKIISMTNAILWRQRRWGGVRIGDPFVLMTGNVVVPLAQKKPPFWRHNVVQNQLLVSSFHLNDENMAAIVKKLREYRPVYLEAYPSTAFILGRYLLETKQKLGLKAVFTSSEPLYPSYRQAIEEGFDCQVYDYLGMAERVVFATQCEVHEGHHVNSDYGICEILDDDGNPAPRGAAGNIVATGLHNLAMPLIRYKTGDRTAHLDKDCTCGRNFPLIEDVTTKSESIIRTTDGRFISPSVMTHPFKPLHGIRESQIIQEDLRHLHIKLVREPGGEEVKVDQLIREIKNRVGDDMDVRVEFVEKIPRTAAGKLRWVISNVS